VTSTTTPRRSAAAPRCAGLVGAFALHAGLYVAAAATFVAVGAVDGASAGGTPLAVSWAPTPAASDDVVALPPTVDDARTPPPQVRPPGEDVAVVGSPIETPPSTVDDRSTSDCESATPATPHAYSAPLPPRRGGGAGSGVASTAIGVGGPGGSGGGVGAGGGWSGSGAGSTAGDGDGGDVGGRSGRGGATRGPSVVGTLPAPQYPSKARSRGWEGRVVLSLSIDEHGHVVAVEVAESSGRAALDEAACDAAREWSFAPALYDDSPVAGTLRVPVRFELRD